MSDAKIEPFEDDTVLDTWEQLSETLGDAALAREVMRSLAVTYWNMPWPTFRALAIEGAK